jgi:hypothetical protein
MAKRRVMKSEIGRLLSQIDELLRENASLRAYIDILNRARGYGAVDGKTVPPAYHHSHFPFRPKG